MEKLYHSKKRTALSATRSLNKEPNPGGPMESHKALLKQHKAVKACVAKKIVVHSSSSSSEDPPEPSEEEPVKSPGDFLERSERTSIVWGQQANRWTWTFNNYTQKDIDHLEALTAEEINYIIFQQEVAPSGTPHLQGYTEFPKKVTKLQACKILDSRTEKAWERKDLSYMKIWLSSSKGNRQSNIDYCSGADKRDPDVDHYYEIVYKLPTRGEGVCKNSSTRNEDYADAMTAISKIQSPSDEIEFYHNHPDIALKHLPNIKLLLQTFKGAEGLASAMKRLPENIRLPLWGRGLVNLLKGPPPDRDIIWIWSKIGDVYKTFMAKYCMMYLNALLVDNGKSADLAFIWTGQPIIWFDLACSGNEDAVNYHAIEKFKNGIVMSPKYQSSIKIYPAPWIICTSNFRFPGGKVKKDRPKITRLDKTHRTLEPMHDGLVEIHPERISKKSFDMLETFGLKFKGLDEASSGDESENELRIDDELRFE